MIFTRKKIVSIVLIGTTCVALALAVAWLGWYGKELEKDTPFSELGEPIPTIEFDTFKPGDILASPATITGKARSDWFYGNELAAEVRSEDGAMLGSARALALAEPKGTELVPFTLDIPFNPAGLRSGFLVFIKSNPENLSEDNMQEAFSASFVQSPEAAQ